MHKLLGAVSSKPAASAGNSLSLPLVDVEDDVLRVEVFDLLVVPDPRPNVVHSDISALRTGGPHTDGHCSFTWPVPPCIGTAAEKATTGASARATRRTGSPPLVEDASPTSSDSARSKTPRSERRSEIGCDERVLLGSRAVLRGIGAVDTEYARSAALSCNGEPRSEAAANVDHATSGNSGQYERQDHISRAPRRISPSLEPTGAVLRR